LKVRDRRHAKHPYQFFQDIKQHLIDASDPVKDDDSSHQNNIQPVMTIFQSQSLNEPFGNRFWSSQPVRYAAYKDPMSGKITGDPANIELTDYLINSKLWTPPNEISPFDILPLVLKLAGRSKPRVFELPKECVFEVDLKHPTNEKLSALGYRWTAVPAISELKMNLGGIVYQNIHFNGGWFVSTEIVRALMERYDAGPEIAKVLGIDTETNPVWRTEVSAELEKMVIHSFQTSGYTIKDQVSAGQSFCSHARREREEYGRECPAQWSAIGGLIGQTNPTWHLEMRDFRINPQLEDCAKGMLIHTALGSEDDMSTTTTDLSLCSYDSIDTDIPRVLIAYGSETGNAESIARGLARSLRLLKPILLSLDMAKGLEIVPKRGITHVICICSTFDNGGPPANAKEFFGARIKPTQRDVKFAVLALGSTIYPDFCKAGVQLDTLLSEAGLERFAKLTKVDEASGCQLVVSGWANMVARIVMPPSLKKFLRKKSNGTSDVYPMHSFKWLANEGQTPKWVKDKICELESHKKGLLCIANEELSSSDSSKPIHRVTFGGAGKYETGDHVSVLPQNSQFVVHRFLSCFDEELRSLCEKQFGKSGKKSLDWLSKQPFYIQIKEDGTDILADTIFEVPTTLEHVLKSKLELGLSEKYVPEFLTLIKMLFEEETLDGLEESVRDEVLLVPKVQKLLSITKSLEGSKMSAENAAAFTSSYPTLPDFFEEFKDILLESYFGDTPVLGLAEMLVAMNRLQPRYYSISSSNSMDPEEISLTVGVLDTKTSSGVEIEGVCSNYLAGLRPGIDRAFVTIRSSQFRLPKNPKAPIIIACAGTGLSPIVGFLTDRLEEKKNGSKIGIIHLFFGCRTKENFIYRDFLFRLKKAGVIKLHLALSQNPGTPKQYVQDKILQKGKEINSLLTRDDTHYYVCGDARMANSCYESCIKILRQYEKKSRVSSALFLKRMRTQGRWQSDVWGIALHYEDAKKDIMKSKREAARLWMANFRPKD